MGVWSSIAPFWRGFICGGIAVPLVIVLIEVIVKYCLYGKMFWK